MASVQGFRQYFGVDRVHSCCVLPLYHVSGLMQVMRSFTSGGQLTIVPLRELLTCPIDPRHFFLSLVPTQLQRLLDTPHPSIPSSPHPLSSFQTILLGGAPAWSDLLERARQQRLRLAPTYGMTETASQIATLKPEDFLRGKSGCGQVLPHARVVIRGASGEVLGANQTGTITIQSSSRSLGYFPNPIPHPPSPTSPYQTDDLGFLDSEGYLHIVGRNSDKIITGGENVFPAEVEAAIRATGQVQDVCVVGVGDRRWGQAVTAVYVPLETEICLETVRAGLTQCLCKFKHPKQWVAVEQLPRNAQGKINRKQVTAIAEQLLN
jgi:O-succinylbenzoic acid--CoA ligase